MEKENNDDIQVDSLAHRLNQLFKSIEIPEQVTEIEISEDTWQAIRHVRKQEKKIKKIETKNLNLSEESMKKYNKAKELLEQSKSLVLELIEAELSIHSQSFYVREKGIGSASIQKLAHEKESMRVENLFNLYERMIS